MYGWQSKHRSRLLKCIRRNLRPEEEIGGISKELGISVSIISIEGQDCRLDALNFVTSQTEGGIFKESPDKLLT